MKGGTKDVTKYVYWGFNDTRYESFVSAICMGSGFHVRMRIIAVSSSLVIPLYSKLKAGRRSRHV